MRKGLFLITTFLVVGCGSEHRRSWDRAMGDSLRARATPTQLQQATVCAAGSTLSAIDVSKWQGDINWGQVAGDDVSFAYIRVSDGLDYFDDKFAQNWAGARSNGVTRGAYQFFRSNESAVDQAQLLLDTMGPLQQGDLPPVIDVESTDGQTPAVIAQRVGEWIDHVEAALGVQPMIYTGRYFWRDEVQSSAYSGYPLWIAHWGASCPTIPDQWSSWVLWQTGDTGSVSGISGNVDTNTFNGGAAQLVEFGAEVVIECGDGACNGDETSATCPQDCPVCESIPQAGRTIDDDDLCFSAGGNPQYITAVSGSGYGGSLRWTTTWQSSAPDNYGLWQFNFETAGRYRVEVYTDAAHAEWSSAPYQVHHSGTTDTSVVDQTATDGWAFVGDFDFSAGGSQWLRLDDIVDNSAAAGQKFVLDAVRLSHRDPDQMDAGVVSPDASVVGPDAWLTGDATGGLPDASAADRRITADAASPDVAVADVSGGDTYRPDTSAVTTQSQPDGGGGQTNVSIMSGCACDSAQQNSAWHLVLVLFALVSRFSRPARG